MKGYTLIEILVSLTIIGILFTVGYAGFRDFSNRQAVAGAAKDIQGDLSLAQGYALAGQKPDECTGHDLIGYNFDVIDNGDSTNEYQIQAVCSGATNPIVVVVKDVTIAYTNITIEMPSPDPILFKVLGSGTNIQDGQTATIILKQTGTGNQSDILVGSGGDIK